MGDAFCFLITILDSSNTLVRCALKFSMGDVYKLPLPTDFCVHSLVTYPMEEESRKVFRSMLPPYLQEMGPIVEVKEIYTIHCFQLASFLAV